MIASTERDNYIRLNYFNFFLFGTMAVLVSYLPLYLGNIGFTPIQIGFLISIGPVISIFANPVWGFWSDRLQNDRLILLILLIGNLFISLFVFGIDAFFPLTFVILLFYFFQTAIFPISTNLILFAVDKTNRSFGSYRLWGSLGFAIVAVTLGPIVQWMGIGQIGWLYGMFMVVTIIFCISIPKEGKASTPISFRDLKKIYINRYFNVFLLLTVLVSIPNMMNYTFISLYIDEMGGSEIFVGWAFFIAAIGEVPVFLLLDRYLKTTSKAMIGILAATCLLFSVRWFLMGLAGTPLFIAVVQFLHCITFGVYFYTGTKLSAHLVPVQYRASGQVAYAIAWSGLSGIMVGLFGGWIYEWLGPRGMYGLGGFMSLAGWVGFTVMWRRLRGTEELSSNK